MFKVIKLTRLGEEDMYNHVAIIHCHPLRVAQAINSRGTCAAALTCKFFYTVNE